MSTSDGGVYCPHCGRFLAPKKQEILKGHEVTIGYEACSCEGAIEERRREEAELRKREEIEETERRERLFRSAGIPKHFWPDIVTINPRAVDRIRAGGSLYLVGDVGSGKTTYACQVAKRLLLAGERSIRFLPAADLSPLVRSSYRRDAKESENDIVTRFATCRVLILDDLGKDGTTDHAVGALERIIDWRYREEYPVIVTAQFERDELINRLAKNGNVESAKAIASRLKEMCHRILFTSPDRRLGKQLSIEGDAE